MKLLLTNRNFSLLWWGGLVSMMGDWALRIALPVYIYQETGSTLATGLMFMAGTLPRILLGTLAGIFVDRWDYRRTLITANLLLAVSLLPLALATGWLWLVYLVAAMQAAIAQFVGPAENALLPKLVPEEQLSSANALNALNNNLARLVGPAIGGLGMGFFGLSGVVVLDAATFLVAAGLVALVAATRKPSRLEGTPEAGGGLAAVWLEFLAGLRLIRRNRAVLTLLGMAALMALGEGVMSTLFIPFVTEVLGGQALEVGWLMSSQAVGGILGGVAISSVARRFAPVRLLGWGALGLGVVDLFIFNYPAWFPTLIPALLLFALAGLPVSALQAGYLTLLQTQVAAPFRGRVFGSYGTVTAIFNLVGIGAAAYLGDQLGIVPVINTQGVVYVLAGLVALTALRRQVLARAAA